MSSKNHRVNQMVLCIMLAGIFNQACSQAVGGGMGGSSRIDGNVKFMPIPYLNYDRSAGITLGAVPMLMFNPVKKDTVSPSSLAGVVGTYAQNNTWFLMGFGKFFLAEDNWRVSTAGGIGAIYFQFYLDGIIGGWIPYRTDARFYMLRVERRIYQEIYGGATYIYRQAVSASEDFPVTDSSQNHGLGLNLSMDHRDNPHYPRKGYISNIMYNVFPGFFGNENPNQKLQLYHNHYFAVRGQKDVVAARASLGIGLGELAFSQQFIVNNNDIRGYTQGAYRGNHRLALQGEYRWNFHRRWGAVGFAGVATVFEAVNEADNGKLLPGGGAGIRFRAFPETNFSVGLDLAVGLDDWGVYFQIGEAF